MTLAATRAVDSFPGGSGPLASAAVARRDPVQPPVEPTVHSDAGGAPPAMTTAPLDLLIKGVRVVRPGQAAVERARPRRAGRSLRADRARHPGRRRARGLRRPGLARLPGRGGRPHARRDLRAARRRRGQREPGGGDGRRDHDADVLPHGPVLPESRRPVCRFFPEVLQRSEGRYWVDYGYHLAPIHAAHLDEMEALATAHGVPSFKIFMFYGGYGLHGSADPGALRRFLLLEPDEHYDLAHFEFVMRAAARVRERHPQRRRGEREPPLRGGGHPERLHPAGRAGPAAHRPAGVQRRPPAPLGGPRRLDRRLPGPRERVWNVNLLHLSSREALEAAVGVGRAFPRSTSGARSRRAPRARLRHAGRRPRQGEPADPLAGRRRGALAGCARGTVDWIVSDHACCAREVKTAADRPDDVWLAKAGFGGTETCSRPSSARARGGGCRITGWPS